MLLPQFSSSPAVEKEEEEEALCIIESRRVVGLAVVTLRKI
jgi:hypothetical protein